MAATKDDDNWECSVEMQEKLIKLHSTNKKKWITDITKMMRDHPSKFSILTVGVKDDGDNLYTFEEFSSHFESSINNKQLLKLIYNDINHYDDTHIKFIAITNWVNDVKLQKETEITKDHKWLFTKILHVQAAHLDADGSGTVDRQEFVNYFVTKIGFPSKVANAIFDDIDINNDGDLSIMEYTKWKSKHNKPDKLKKFLDKIKKQIEKKKLQNKIDNDNDSKCENCDEIKKEINILNGKYKQLELKLKSVNSKHTNLLQDYEKLSTLLSKEQTKNISKNISKNENDKLIYQRENKKLIEENKIHTTEINNNNRKINNLEKKIKKLNLENEELKNDNSILIKNKISSKDKEKISKLEMNIKLKDEEIEILSLNAVKQKEMNDNCIKNKIKMYKIENEELNDKIDEQNKKIKDFKKEINVFEEKNDELKIEINTKIEEIKLLKNRRNNVNVNVNNNTEKSQELEFQINKQKKEIRRLKNEIEEIEENKDKIEKEKRKIKTELNQKDGEITLLKHKLELLESNKELANETETEQIKKLKIINKELDSENMKQELQIKNLKEEIKNLEQDLQKEIDIINKLQIELNKEKSSIENYVKRENISTNKLNTKNKEIDELNKKLNELNSLLESHHIEKEKISAEKQILLEKVEKEKNNQVALMAQFDKIENKKIKSVESVSIELNQLKEKCDKLQNKLNENDKKQKEIIINTDEEIAKLTNENTNLKKKVQTEKNHLKAVLIEVEKIQKTQDDEKKNQVIKQCIKPKHDLSKLNIQIEILNSDTFRIKSLLLLSKYEKIDKKKYYGFLDFTAKDNLSDKALNNVYKKLKVTDKISANALAPLLGVIVKLYTIRLNKLKTGKNNNNQIDRRVIEHLGVWIIRQHSKKTNKSETLTVLNDNNQKIKGTYAVYDGYVLKKEMATLFASWCEEYVECQGRHDDSQLK